MSNQTNSQTIPARKVLLVSFLVDFTDLILGVIVTILSGSVVMLSQALQGAADLASSGLLLFGLNRSRKRADASHPFGYGRELYFWTLISAIIMLAFTSSLSIYFGWQRLINPEPLHNTFYAYAVLVFTTATNGYALSLSLRRLIHKKPLSKLWVVFYQSSLIETKSAFVLDLMGTSASIVGFVALVFYGLTNNARFDGWGAIAIGIVLATLAIILLTAVKDFLIGKSIPIQTIELIKKAAQKVPDVKSVQDLKATHIGPDKILINIEINVQNNLTTDELEKVIDDVKDEIKKDLPSTSHIQVELESTG